MVLLAAAGGGCGVGADGTARAIDPAKVPPGLGSTSSTTTILDDQTDIDLTQPAELWFVRADRLVAVDRRVPIGTAPAYLLEELLKGPTPAERNLSLRSALLDLDLFKSARQSSGVVTVDLTENFSGLPSTEQLLAVGQIVGSLTSLPGVGLVSFRLAGSPVDVPVGDGSQAPGPVSREDYDELQAP